MKKQTKKLLIALFALLILAGGYVALMLFSPTEETEEKTEEDEVVYTVEEDTIRKITYTNSNGTIELVLEEDAWSSPTDEACPVNGYTVKSMITALQEIKASRTITKEEADLEEFGFSDPTLVVDFEQKDGTKTTYTLGMLNNVVDKYYFQVSGNDNVYLIDSTLYHSFDYDLLHLAEVEEYPSLGAQDIYEYTLTLNGETMYFKDTKDVAHKKNAEEIPDSLWKYGKSEDDLKRLDTDSADELIQEIISLSNSECVTYKLTKQDLKDCGLDSPKMTLKVKYTELDISEEDSEESEITDHSYTIYFGNNDPESGEYYVNMEGSNAIYTMNVSDVDVLMSAFEEK
ncbi:MAG: DUF4340 domain-containing protein [Lachnospiraceae bacterium]|nr:DUF4340 domain-containing protein [Lachnospiraceae bacterium]